MKITRLVVWEVALTSHVAYHMAGGKTCDTVTSVLVRVVPMKTSRGGARFARSPTIYPRMQKVSAQRSNIWRPVIIGADALSDPKP